MHIYTAAMTAYESVAAATEETLFQLVTPSTRRARILEIAVGLRSVTSTDQAALVKLLRQTSAGTSSGTLTPRAHDPADPAALCTAAITFTAEPTAGDVLKTWNVVVQSGLLVYPLLDAELFMAVSTRLGLSVNSPQAQSVLAYVTWQE